MMRHTRQSVSRDIMDDIECERRRKYEKCLARLIKIHKQRKSAKQDGSPDKAHR